MSEIRGADPKDLQRSALLRSVTHDLRSPLAAIRAIASDLRDGIEYDDETRVELLQTVCDEVDRLDRLVGNLLSMSRIEAGVLEPRRQAVAADELVRHRLRALEPLLRDVVLEVDVPADLPLIDGDFGQLEEVLTNLLANAARHAPGGSTVAIGATVIVEPDGRELVEIEVADHGPGVPEAWRGRIFEAFQRGPGSRSTGLGLAISAGIIQAHGGRMALRDTPGGGATFAFSVPVRHDEVDAAGAGNGAGAIATATGDEGATVGAVEAVDTVGGADAEGGS